jgi:hypothetical protein
MTVIRRACIALLLLSLMGSRAIVEDPALKPGKDPGGTAVAVLADGFDYTRPELAKVLARDGEGEAIAWDAVDGDHRPFAREGGGTDVAVAAAARGGVRIVAVRVAATGRASLAKGVAFTAGTPARIVLALLDDKERGELAVMSAAAKRFEHSLFVVSVPAPTPDEKKDIESMVNLVLLNSAENKLAVAEAIARALGCGELSGDKGSALKSAFLGRLDEKSPTGCDAESGTKRE